MSNLFHRVLLLNVSTSSIIPNCRKSLRSFWLKSARWFLAKAVIAKSGYSGVMVEVDHPRAAALAPAFQSPPQLPHATRSWDEIASRWVVGEIIHQKYPFLIIHELVGG